MLTFHLLDFVITDALNLAIVLLKLLYFRFFFDMLLKLRLVCNKADILLN